MTHLTLVEPAHLLVAIYFLVEELTLGFEVVSLLIELINVVVKRIVLLLSLDKCRHDFIDVGDPCGVLNGFKSLFNDLGIPHVLVQQFLLLLVFVRYLSQTDFENFDWVGEGTLLVAWSLAVLHLGYALVVEFDWLVTLFEALLQLLDFKFKHFFSFLVLSLESQNLVVSLRGSPSLDNSITIGLCRPVHQRVDSLSHRIDGALSEADLLSHDVDVVLQVLVVADGVVEQDFLVAKAMVQGEPFHLSFMFSLFIANVLFDLVLDLLKLLHLLFVLVFKDEVSLSLMFELLGVEICLALETLSLSFVHVDLARSAMQFTHHFSLIYLIT